MIAIHAGAPHELNEYPRRHRGSGAAAGRVRHADIRQTPVVLRATDDPGVTVRVASTSAGVPEQVATVPAELTFHGESFDLDCVHGPQPGRLALVASRGGVSISTGDTTQAGQVTQIQIRRGSIAIGVPGDASEHK